MQDNAFSDAARSCLFVTDLDGTLLNSRAEVSNKSASIISDLSHRGALITVATARTPATVDHILQHTFTRLPAIVMTGAALWDRRHRRFLNPIKIGCEKAAAAVDILRSHDVTPFIYNLADDSTLNVYVNGSLTDREMRFIGDRTGLSLKRFFINEPEGLAVDFSQTMLVFAMGASDRLLPIADELDRVGDLTVSVYPDNYNPSVAVLEIFAGGVSKAAAIRRLADEVGATHVTVFGDNLNDLTMMAVADEAVAVANAHPDVLQMATTIIGPNTDDAVAEYIAATLDSLR